MIKRWLPAIILTILALVLVGIKIYPTLKNQFFSDELDTLQYNESSDRDENNFQYNESPEKDKNNTNNDNPVHRGIKENTFPFNTKEEKKLAEKYPDQFNIVEMMYYSWDYIDNAQGEYEIQWSKDKNEKTYNQFYVDFENGKNRATSKLVRDGKVIETHNVLLKDKMAVRQMPEKNIFSKEPIENNPRRSAGALQNHYIGLFHSDITNSEWFTLINGNYPDWTYKEKEYLGIPAYHIEGNISYDTSNALEGQFSMVVSKDTGVLLDLKCYGQSDEVIFAITVKSLSLNKGVPNDIFVLDVNGNKEVDNTEYNLSGVGNIGGNKPDGVESDNE